MDPLRLTDYDRYAIRGAASNISNIEVIFTQQAWPVLHSSLSRTPQLELLAQHPWLQPLASTSGNFDEIAVMLSEGYNKPTLAMLELDTLSSNYLLATLFKSKIRAKFPPAKAILLLEASKYPQEAVQDLSKVFSAFQETIRPLLFGDPLESPSSATPAGSITDGLGLVSTDARQARQYRIVFAKKVEQLCLAVGVPEIVVNPRANIFALRKFLASRPQVHSGQANLQLQVDQLTERTRWQGRFITNLMYRHLMDRLPTSDSQASPRERWATFFAQAMDTAQIMDPAPGHSSSHPLATLLRGSNDSERRQQIMRIGEQLYDLIDNNIRASSIQYQPANDQWDAEPLALLQALKPVSYLGSGEVDWEVERRRYLDPSAPVSLPSHSRELNGTQTVQAPVANEVAQPPPYSTV